VWCCRGIARRCAEVASHPDGELPTGAGAASGCPQPLSPLPGPVPPVGGQGSDAFPEDQALGGGVTPLLLQPAGWRCPRPCVTPLGPAGTGHGRGGCCGSQAGFPGWKHQPLWDAQPGGPLHQWHTGCWGSAVPAPSPGLQPLPRSQSSDPCKSWPRFAPRLSPQWLHSGGPCPKELLGQSSFFRPLRLKVHPLQKLLTHPLKLNLRLDEAKGGERRHLGGLFTQGKALRAQPLQPARPPQPGAGSAARMCGGRRRRTRPHCEKAS